MSILLTDTWLMRPVEAADAATPLHQSSSGPPPSARPRRWWRGWFDRQDERIALREIADDPHLLNDLGLTRDAVLREAAKTFWL